MNTNPNILNGKVCPYCGCNSEYISDVELYGRIYGNGMFYVCKPCDAWVGTHKPRPTEALGRLANKELRNAKIQAHFYFDQLWKRKIERINCSKSKARKLAYKWLSEQTGIEYKYCHIGFMDVEECKQVTEACKPFFRKQELIIK